METMGELIRNNRRLLSFDQSELAERVDTTAQWISALENGRKLPSLVLLMKLYEVLVKSRDSEASSPLVTWLLQWLAEGGQADDKLTSLEKGDLQAAIESARVLLDAAAGRYSPGKGRTLKQFPEAFYPLTIVCGDRREDPPHTEGDLLAYSAAMTDLMFLPGLGLAGEQAVTIVSDKLFVMQNEATLARMFGQTNLLLIGSPAANFATRLINNKALFRFDLRAKSRAWAGQIAAVAGTLDEPRKLEAFLRLIQQPNQVIRAVFEERGVSEEELEGSLIPAVVKRLFDLDEDEVRELVTLKDEIFGKEKPADWMNSFRKPGFVDPASQRFYGSTTGPNIDFGVVSLARNPFAASDDYVCIIAAGIHGPGTAHAVKALTRHDLFDERPLGGVIEVSLTKWTDWRTRFERVGWKWQTRPYTSDSLKANFESALNQTVADRGPAFADMSDDDLRESLVFLQNLSG